MCERLQGVLARVRGKLCWEVVCCEAAEAKLQHLEQQELILPPTDELTQNGRELAVCG